MTFLIRMTRKTSSLRLSARETIYMTKDCISDKLCNKNLNPEQSPVNPISQKVNKEMTGFRHGKKKTPPFCGGVFEKFNLRSN